ncbi:hypothetical protein DFS34DRAFT_591089 [Phlyctochytrium arcticum]|nr:hypothetical protein DFS34DRAFT_591089 [Phlyctochytrium arcticum]
MFSIEEDNLEQTLLCEAAALAAACDPTDDPVALLTLCSPDIADYYTGKRQTKPHHDDPQGFFRDWGYVGILEYLLQAEDVQRDIILPLCLDCLDYQDILAQSSDQPITGAFVRETTSRLVQLANTHLSVREAINETIWDWCNGFLSLIAKGESQTKLQLGLVSLAGVFQALSVSPVIATLPYISDFLHTAFTTLDFERLQSNEASYNSPTGIEHFTLHDRQCEPADVVHAIFDYIHHVLLSTIKYSAQPATWKDLGKFSLHEGQDMLESDKIAIRSLFNMCWRFLPSPMLQHLLNDMHRSSTYHKALPVVVQSGILCVFQCPDLGPALFSALATVLQEKDPTFVCRAGPDIYLSALEGVATIIRGYPELRSHARKALLTFLRDPSAAFTQWANDPDAISAMRNCGSRVLLLTLQMSFLMQSTRLRIVSPLRHLFWKRA